MHLLNVKQDNSSLLDACRIKVKISPLRANWETNKQTNKQTRNQETVLLPTPLDLVLISDNGKFTHKGRKTLVMLYVTNDNKKYNHIIKFK